MNLTVFEITSRLQQVADRGLLLLAQTEAEAVPSSVQDGGAQTGGAVEGTGTEGPVTEGAGAVEGAAEVGFFEQFFGNPLNLILISGILFIMLVLRPQQRQMKELQQSLANLKKNDRVVTSGGVHGTVVTAAAGEATVTIRIDDNSGARMTVNRDAIAKIVEPENKEKANN